MPDRGYLSRMRNFFADGTPTAKKSIVQGFTYAGGAAAGTAILVGETALATTVSILGPITAIAGGTYEERRTKGYDRSAESLGSREGSGGELRRDIDASPFGRAFRPYKTLTQYLYGEEIERGKGPVDRDYALEHEVFEKSFQWNSTSKRFFIEFFRDSLVNVKPLERTIADNLTAHANIENLTLPGATPTSIKAIIDTAGGAAPDVATQQRKDAAEAIVAVLKDHYENAKAQKLLEMQDRCTRELREIEAGITTQPLEYSLKTIRSLRADYRTELAELQHQETNLLMQPENRAHLATAAGLLTLDDEQIKKIVAKKHQDELAQADKEFARLESFVQNKPLNYAHKKADWAKILSFQSQEQRAAALATQQDEAEKKASAEGQVVDIARITAGGLRNLQLGHFDYFTTEYGNKIENNHDGTFSMKIYAHFTPKTLHGDIQFMIQLIRQDRTNEQQGLEMNCGTLDAAKAIYECGRLAGYAADKIKIKNTRTGKDWNFDEDKAFTQGVEMMVDKLAARRQESSETDGAKKAFNHVKSRLHAVRDPSSPPPISPEYSSPGVSVRT